MQKEAKGEPNGPLTGLETCRGLRECRVGVFNGLVTRTGLAAPVSEMRLFAFPWCGRPLMAGEGCASRRAPSQGECPSLTRTERHG